MPDRLSAVTARSPDAACGECGHDREDHCHCGSVCTKCDCSRYRSMGGDLAPCPGCGSSQHLKRLEWDEGGRRRATYRCISCHGEYVDA